MLEERGGPKARALFEKFMTDVERLTKDEGDSADSGRDRGQHTQMRLEQARCRRRLIQFAERSAPRRMAPGDVVLVTKLDRFGRSTRELLELIERIGQADTFFKSLGDPLFDITIPTGRLLSILLAAIAEFERELNGERTGEGRKRAKARGARFGRPSVLTPNQRTEVLARLAAGDSCADVARSY